MKIRLAVFGATILAGLTMVAVSRGATPARTDQPGVAAQAARCAQLAGGQVAGATVLKADFVTRGATLPPFADKTEFDFCRVDAAISPTAGSRIKMAIWLPADWNGKIVGAGGGGFEGGYNGAVLGLRMFAARGYASVTTDAGHDASPEPLWAVAAPEKLIDYGHRANHLGAVVGKALVASYYGKPAGRAIFSGCSNGGRDALMLAQRYPSDYDAIIAGAPANDFTGLMSSFAWTARNSSAPGISLSAEKLKLLNAAAVKSCDARDGVTDGLIERPDRCRFDPARLQCKPGDAAATCLSSAEVGVVRSIYRGPQGRTGRQVIPGYPVGSEYDWANWLTTPKAVGPAMGRQFFALMVYGDPKRSIPFEIDRDDAAAQDRLGPVVDAVDPDLRPFFKRGGKLLMFHGWDDAAIPAGNTLNYVAAMNRASGPVALRQARLFMMPGVAHCNGGNGPGTVDWLQAIDRWAETGTAPERLTATKPESVYRAMADLPTKTLRTRPVCAWPKVARYRGGGSIETADSFVCK